MDPVDPASRTSEVLSQSDVERLLQEVAVQESDAFPLQGADPKKRRSFENVQPYDFRQPAFLSAGELRKLRLRHEAFINALAARLSIYLRLEFGLRMSRLQTVNYQKFMDSLPNPTHITLFKVEPLRGVCLLEVPTRLGLTIVDRLLGGPAHSAAAERDLSDIEIALLDQAVQIILNEWCSHWASLQDLRPVVLGHETNSRFVQTAPHDTIMLTLSMEARIGDCLETMQLGIPYYTLEPLVLQMDDPAEPQDRNPAAPAQSPAVRWNPALDDMKIPVHAEWQGLELTARELSRLKTGDILQLSAQAAGQVLLRLADVPRFSGRLGTQDGMWAVELTRILKS